MITIPDLIRDPDEAVRELGNEVELALDLETSGLSPWKDCIAVVILKGKSTGKVAVLHTRGNMPDPLLRMLSAPGRTLVGHNTTQFDALLLANAGMDIFAPTWHDTMVGELSILKTDRRDVSVSLKASTQRRLGKSTKTNIVHSWMVEELNEQQLGYCAGDIGQLFELRDAQFERAAEGGVLESLKLEQAIIPSVMRMSLNGLPFDKSAYRQYIDQQAKVQWETQKSLEVAFGEINLNSPAQVKRALVAYGIDVPDTKAETLLELQQAFEGAEDTEEAKIVSWILSNRHAAQRLKMYTDEWVDKYVYRGWVHSRFWQVSTDTGRFCVTGDTPVEAPRNMRTHPLGIPISELRPGQWVYSFTWDKKLCLRKVRWVGITGRKQVIKLKLESKWRGESREIRLTPDHLVRTLRGEWIPAGSLRLGQKLMSMPRRGPTEDGGYLLFGANAERHGLQTKTQGKLYEHRWVYSQLHDLSRIPAHHDVHHRDEDTWNNEPENLELFTKARHMSYHAQERREEMSQEHPRDWHGRLEPGYHYSGPRRSWKGVNDSGVIQTGTGYEVIGIEVGSIENVWDCEVEDTHTFIGNGVALHNSSSDPNLQQVPKDMRWVFGNAEGFTVVSRDYNQIESVVMGVLSRDQNLLKAVEGDIYSAIYAQAFRVDPSEVSKDQRFLGKAMIFTFLFGGGFKKFRWYVNLRGADLSLEQAKEIQMRFFVAFPNLRRMRDKARETADRGGPVVLRLPTGLQRVLVGRNAQATRILNTLGQGTAAAGLKFSLLEAQATGGDKYLGAVVHDEMVAAIPDDLVEEQDALIHSAMLAGMRRAIGDANVRVAMKKGPTWGPRPSDDEL